MCTFLYKFFLFLCKICAHFLHISNLHSVFRPREDTVIYTKMCTFLCTFFAHNFAHFLHIILHIFYTFLCTYLNIGTYIGTYISTKCAKKSAKNFANESAKNSAKCVKNCVNFFSSCVKFVHIFCTFQIYTAFSDHVKIPLRSLHVV